jgi:hypothetical protein
MGHLPRKKDPDGSWAKQPHAGATWAVGVGNEDPIGSMTEDSHATR